MNSAAPRRNKKRSTVSPVVVICIHCFCAFFSFEVDGQFTPWSDWSECSKTCGSDSYRKRERTCTDPPPRYGGEDCQGRTVERRHCLRPPCTAKLDAYNISKVFLQVVNSRNGEITTVVFRYICKTSQPNLLFTKRQQFQEVFFFACGRLTLLFGYPNQAIWKKIDQ